MNESPPQQGGHNTVGHQGACPYDWIPAPHLNVHLNHPTTQGTSHLAATTFYATSSDVIQTQQQSQLSTAATHIQTGQTTLLERTQDQTAATAPSQLIQAIGTANT